VRSHSKPAEAPRAPGRHLTTKEASPIRPGVSKLRPYTDGNLNLWKSRPYTDGGAAFWLQFHRHRIEPGVHCAC